MLVLLRRRLVERVSQVVALAHRAVVEGEGMICLGMCGSKLSAGARSDTMSMGR